MKWKFDLLLVLEKNSGDHQSHYDPSSEDMNFCTTAVGIVESGPMLDQLTDQYTDTIQKAMLLAILKRLLRISTVTTNPKICCHHLMIHPLTHSPWLYSSLINDSSVIALNVSGGPMMNPPPQHAQTYRAVSHGEMKVAGPGTVSFSNLRQVSV